MNPYSYAHLIFDKGAKNNDGKLTVYSANVSGKSGYLPAKTDTRSMSINSKWI
jgi:hypothetical protein